MSQNTQLARLLKEFRILSAVKMEWDAERDIVLVQRDGWALREGVLSDDNIWLEEQHFSGTKFRIRKVDVGASIKALETSTSTNSRPCLYQVLKKQGRYFLKTVIHQLSDDSGRNLFHLIPEKTLESYREGIIQEGL